MSARDAATAGPERFTGFPSRMDFTSVPTLFLICGATGVVAALLLSTLIHPIARLLEKHG